MSKAKALREKSPTYDTNGESGAGEKLKFIDLFCGIGGFRIAFERAGCESRQITGTPQRFKYSNVES
jgi:hypothetical protein